MSTEERLTVNEPRTPTPPPGQDFHLAAPETMPQEDAAQFSIRIAPAVLATIARLAALQVPGVLRLAEPPPGKRLWRNRGWTTYANDGVRLAVQDGRLRVAVYVVVARDRHLQSVASAVQEAVGQALDTLVGMTAESTDVYVQDVD